MSYTLQLVIVLIAVAISAICLIRNIFIKTRRKGPNCHSCPLNCGCDKKCGPDKKCGHHNKRQPPSFTPRNSGAAHDGKS